MAALTKLMQQPPYNKRLMINVVYCKLQIVIMEWRM